MSYLTPNFGIYNIRQVECLFLLLSKGHATLNIDFSALFMSTYNKSFSCANDKKRSYANKLLLVY